MSTPEIPDAARIGHHRWRRSSYSGQGGGQCVELAHLAGGFAAVRDSKDPHGPALSLTTASLAQLLDEVHSL